MASVNKAIILGNLGQDPELRYTAEGKAYCVLSVATNEEWTSYSGERHKEVEWHKAIVWEKVAENAAKYLSKGSTVYIEGRTKTRKYTTTAGEERAEKQIQVEPFGLKYLGGHEDAEGSVIGQVAEEARQLLANNVIGRVAPEARQPPSADRAAPKPASKGPVIKPNTAAKPNSTAPFDASTDDIPF